MGVQPVHPNPNSVINPTMPKHTINLIVAATAIPGYVVRHDKNSVVISGEKLAEVLRQLYEAGLRYVEAVIEVAGQRIAIDGTIYSKYDKRRNRTYYWLYVLQPGQAVLRTLFDEYRRGAAPRAKRPLPVLIHRISVSLKPK
jgi:RNase P/RNase MRP subunit p29